jgi:hypothetical protein
MIKKGPGRQELPIKRVRSAVPLPAMMCGSARDQIAEMCKQLLSFEESLDWEFVYAEKFRHTRTPWRTHLSRASSLRHVEQGLKELVKVRSTIETWRAQNTELNAAF